MSDRSTTVDSPRTLVEGQRLDQPTFHALYQATPPGTRAELINGVVLMPSPVGPPHGRATLLTLMWLGFYQANTPGVEALVDTSTAMGLKSEPQPDALLRILAECRGRTQADHRFVHGVPELLVEVAHTSRYTDLGPKFEDYERVGVLEYVVARSSPTRSSGSCCDGVALSIYHLARTGSAARRSFRDCGSLRTRFWRATSTGCKPSSTSAAPRKSTPTSLRNWPRPGTIPELMGRMWGAKGPWLFVSGFWIISAVIAVRSICPPGCPAPIGARSGPGDTSSREAASPSRLSTSSHPRPCRLPPDHQVPGRFQQTVEETSKPCQHWILASRRAEQTGPLTISLISL